MNFTVIFLTKGRDKIFKSLNSIFNIINYNINLRLIIVDGNDDNRVENLINSKFSNYTKHVKIFKQKKKGFMNGCFESISLVDTEFFTFMYDDDELSPYMGFLVKKSLEENKIFFSYGKVENISNNFNFKEPKFKLLEPNIILKKYFKFIFSKSFTPPNSPICSIFRAKILVEWRYILEKYSSIDKYFDFYLMKKNIGPDLLLYLISLFREKQKIIYSEAYMAKFSSHSNSMSIIYGNLYLGVGYLYARIIFLTFFKQDLEIKKQYNCFKNYVCLKILYFILRGIFYLNKIKPNTQIHLFKLFKKL